MKIVGCDARGCTNAKGEYFRYEGLVRSYYCDKCDGALVFLPKWDERRVVGYMLFCHKCKEEAKNIISGSKLFWVQLD